MRKSRFTEAQIVGMIKEQEAGMATAEAAHQHVSGVVGNDSGVDWSFGHKRGLGL